MNVLISDLYSDYDYSNQVEEYLGKLIAKNYNLNYDNQTTGYNPEYDFTLNDKKIEVKFTSRAWPTIEFARANRKPSGLLLSEANYYLMVSPGGSRGKYVGKIRLIRRNDLLEQFVKVIHNPITSKFFKHYPANQNSPGAICFILNPQDVNDIWLGDCDLLFSTPGHNLVEGFDLSTIGFTGKTLRI